MIKRCISIRTGIECLCSFFHYKSHLNMPHRDRGNKFQFVFDFRIDRLSTVDFIESPEYKVCSRIIYCSASGSRKKCNWLIHALRVVDCLLFCSARVGHGFHARIYALSGRAGLRLDTLVSWDVIAVVVLNTEWMNGTIRDVTNKFANNTREWRYLWNLHYTYCGVFYVQDIIKAVGGDK